MKTENLSTLQIHKLTQEQYDRAAKEGRIDEKAIYLTPNESSGGSGSNGNIGDISQGDFAWTLRSNRHYSLMLREEDE